jgi:hypothetical protein
MSKAPARQAGPRPAPPPPLPRKRGVFPPLPPPRTRTEAAAFVAAYLAPATERVGILLREDDDVEELTQNVFVAFLEKHPKIAPDADMPKLFGELCLVAVRGHVRRGGDRRRAAERVVARDAALPRRPARPCGVGPARAAAAPASGSGPQRRRELEASPVGPGAGLETNVLNFLLPTLKRFAFGVTLVG